ncbi:MAG: short chain fatty acids transporter [Haloquadratum walsbyi J07HQW1]|jgi:short-chain fatty acids transporter|uniref:Short chain fatty acids transporter n=1 Tax=Haloquadratum walsbyi J07HQW1 TaxID=1238424 RepID=U1PDU0_9EURY|nr:MAG: short chain fatty acids transporter [Haloquadratum walsbyi J07HQW1]
MSAADGTLLERIGYWFSDKVERWMPSPFLFAVILTYLVFLAGLAFTSSGPAQLIQSWYDGFWAFLTFAMQMVLILMTGFAIAYHPRVNDVITRLTEIPSNGKQAAVLVGVVAMVLGWIHWGFSLILGGIFAREMGVTAREKGIDVHYPLLATAGYLGLGLTWHWGLSASAPLQIATEGNAFIEMGIVDGVVPTSATIFSSYAIILFVLSVAFAAAMLYLLEPASEQAQGIEEFVDPTILDEKGANEAVTDGSGATLNAGATTDPVPAELVDNSRLLGVIVAVTGVGLFLFQFAQRGLDALSLNVVNWGFLFAGLLIYTNPSAYRDKFAEAASSAAGIILLFPFFAGIQGIMSGSGLAELLATQLVAVASPATFPIVAWLTGAIINLFVPSGGGEWIVVGPSVLQAANDLGVPAGKATIAYAVGDAHTNLLNPFWALPLLAITGIKAREMFGYAVAMLLLLIPFLTIVLYVVPY